jgi:hypothetical protein
VFGQALERVYDEELSDEQRAHPQFVHLLQNYLLDYDIPVCGKCVVRASDDVLRLRDPGVYFRKDLGQSAWRPRPVCLKNAPHFVACGNKECLDRRASVLEFGGRSPQMAAIEEAIEMRRRRRGVRVFKNATKSTTSPAKASPDKRRKVRSGGADAGWLHEDGSGYLLLPETPHIKGVWAELRGVGKQGLSVVSGDESGRKAESNRDAILVGKRGYTKRRKRATAQSRGI